MTGGPATIRRERDARARVAGIADVPGIVDLVESAYRGDASRVGWTTEADLIDGRRTDAAMVRALLVATGSVVLVAGPSARPDACCSLTRDADGVWLGMLAVRPDGQASGRGSALLAAAERYAVERWAVRELSLTAIVQRTDLLRWYERRGYRRTGETRPFPYGDERYGLPRRDDLVLVVLRRAVAEPAPATTPPRPPGPRGFGPAAP